ncbi:hypothetical protein SSX86_008997 [Deinandra increscens subsp. villosa]|uniref:PRLI-interacting factor A n=1 Tax=Deinandra increscens subsp. villosa TaxID=3103831 RepID=A0AAP0DK88_9ASTR
MLDQSQMMNHSQLMSMGQPIPVLSQSHQVMNTQNSQMMMMNKLINNNNPSHMMMNQNQNQSQLNNRRGGGYGMWPPPQADQIMLKNQNAKPSGYRNNKNWKVKRGIDNRDNRNNNNRKELPVIINNVGGAGCYYAPTLKELQQQNRVKARRYISKKKFNNGSNSCKSCKSAPFAPRNTTSFLIRAKKAGGITSLVSPCPVTPAVLPTPIFSPSREVLVDMAKEEWGVDGYGSMKGLIRLRSPGNDEDDGSGESDVEEHLEVERRLDHDLSRFEMIYPNGPNHGGSDNNSYLLESRVDDQDTHIAQLEEENLMLKERLFLMEREFSKLRTRLQSLEMHRGGGQGFIEEVVENDSENESGSRGYGRSSGESNAVLEENSVGNKESDNGDIGEKSLQGLEVVNSVAADDVHMEDGNQRIEEKTNVVIEGDKIGDDHVNGNE